MIYTVNKKKVTSSMDGCTTSFFVSRSLQEMKVVIELDPNGGSVTSQKFTAVVGSKIGELPSATGNGDKLFAGWFNADGVQVTEESVVSSAILKLRAKWVDPVTVTFAPNGGNLSGATSIKAYVGFPLSISGVAFPGATGTEDAPYFKMWSTAADGGEKITPDTIYDGSYTVLYAQYVNASYTVDLNPPGEDQNGGRWGWVVSESVPNPDSTLYDGVYQSNNKHQGNSFARMRINFEGYDNFKVYVRTCGEDGYDYLIAGCIDNEVTEFDFYKAFDYGATTDTNIESYYLIEYPNDGGEHFIEIGYKKDSSVDEKDDCGYVLICKEVS